MQNYSPLQNVVQECLRNWFSDSYAVLKGKAVPLQAWSGPEGSKKLTIPRFHDSGTGRW